MLVLIGEKIEVFFASTEKLNYDVICISTKPKLEIILRLLELE